MALQMFGSFRIAVVSPQFQQVRLGHRMRGKPPIIARSLKERLEEINYKDELYTTRIDIGFPGIRKSPSEERAARLAYMRKLKSDKNFEQLARNHKILVDTEQVRKDWLATTGPIEKKEVAEHYGIFEHLYNEGYFVPRHNLEVFYQQEGNTALPVYTGNVIKPNEAKDTPDVKYDSNNDTFWTLVLTGLDSHLTEGDKEYVHWLVANIPGNDVEKGDSLVNYLQPIPLKGTGFHRYVFVLYKQNDKISYDINTVGPSSPLNSRTFVTREWYSKYQDYITPAGLAFFQSDWDTSITAFFHNNLNMKEPVYEYDFPTPYMRPQEWFPLRKAFNKYMDKYRDPKQINKEFLLRKLKNEDPFQKPEPPVRFPNAHSFPKGMPSWLKEHERKVRMGWGRVNEIK